MIQPYDITVKSVIMTNMGFGNLTLTQVCDSLLGFAEGYTMLFKQPLIKSDMWISIDYLRREHLERVYNGKSYYLAIRACGVESSLFMKRIDERCKALGDWFLLIKVSVDESKKSLGINRFKIVLTYK